MEDIDLKDLIEDYTSVAFDNGDKRVSAAMIIEEYEEDKLTRRQASYVAKQVNAKLVTLYKEQEE